MEYVGIQQQISSNNRKSVILLLAFPLLIFLMVYGVMFFMNFTEEGAPDPKSIFELFLPAIPFIIIGVGIWFAIAYFAHSKMINSAANSHSISRKENMRVYNLMENLTMSVGMTMPKLRIIESDALNAFASGITEKTYTVTLTRGIIEKLEDDELEGVIAHELMHIRNKDVRLLIVSIIFVGIFSFIVQVAFRSVLYGSVGGSRRKNDGKGMIIILVAALVAYLLSMLFKFSLSRKREYMADSGAAQMTRNPDALASALEKISGNHHVDKVKSEDVQQLFIENAPEDSSVGFLGGLGGLFSTHPPIQKRIKILKQF
jgi:heat shock protein HtpX